MNSRSFFRRIALLFKAVPKSVVILFCLVVVAMNVLAQYQFVSLPFLAINAGICVSWLAFLILDVITKHFGAKAANYLSLLAVVVNLLIGSIFFALSVVLNNQNYDIFAFGAWSILLASTIAFVISALTNNYVNVFVGKKIKSNPDGKLAFSLRSYISTFFGQVVDNFIFVFLAFFLLPYIPFAIQVRWTIWQCLGASVLGALIELASEVLFTPIGYRISNYWKKNKVGEEYIKTTYELHNLPAYEIGKLVNEKVLTPMEVVEYFENRINKYNKKINAFTYTKFLEAEKYAKELEIKINNNENVGPFAGVPFALKDFLDSKKGWTNSIGGVRSIDRIDKVDSPFTIAMEKLGGIAIGKCNAPTYGFRGTTDNLRYGPTRNPHNKKYNSGGSSGGSAASVSAGLVPIAEGGDAGGSIRVPASFCGIFGYKASNGTVPMHYASSVDPEVFPFCMNGGLTKSVKDAAILLNEMQGYNKEDPYSIKRDRIDFVSKLDESIKDLKIAYTDDFGIFPVEEQIKRKVFKKAKSLEKLGAKVTKIDFNIPYTKDELIELWCIAISQESAAECLEYIKMNPDFSNDLPKELLYWNKKALDEKDRLKDYKVAKETIKKIFDDIFNEYDLIISPVSGCLAPKNDTNGNTKGPEYINGVKVDSLLGYAMTFLVNFIGNPSCSIPAGHGKHHLPIGLQMIGRYMDDETILKIAANYEKINPFLK